VIKNGENGKGIASRWYPETLAKRISAIRMVRDRIDFVHGDGLTVIEEIKGRSDTAIFIDPPYSAGGKRAGTRLYTHHELDHAALFAHAARLRGSVLMTYDFSEAVQDLARTNGFETAQIAMKNTHHAEMNELLIGRNLAWV
jgi:DNA adenine methylase